MEVVVLKQAFKEMQKLPKEAVVDVQTLFERLENGELLSMPISRPLPSIAKGLHELRLSYKVGEVRVFYVVKVKDAIYILHAAIKKKQGLDKQTQELLLSRIKVIL